MLVSFYKGFMLEGETTLPRKKKHPWSKPELYRTKIHTLTGVSGICDESEVESEIERLTKERIMKGSGWGKDFSGWQRVVPYEEYLEIKEKKNWDNRYLPTYNVNIEYIHTWKMEKILKELDGTQFAQFCRDMEIPNTCNKMRGV